MRHEDRVLTLSSVPKPEVIRRASLGIFLGVVGVLLPVLGRPLALLTLVVLAAGVASLTYEGRSGISRLSLATFVGLVPALVLVGATQDLLGIAPHPSVSAAAIFVAWALVTRTLGASIASRLHDGALRDVWIRVFAVLATSGYVAGALLRLLLPNYTTADRLAWAIWEEDNSHIVGVAREVLTDGPRGARLADQFGTAFVNLPILLIRLLGGPAATESDPRLQAITVFTVSTLAIIVLAGIAMALLASVPHHIHANTPGPRPGPLNTALSATATSIATLMAFSLLVVLPMRTGFLTFVWGLTIVLLGSAYAASTPADAPPLVRSALLLFLLALTALLLSSWPFIAPALAPLLAIPLLWIPWRQVGRWLRNHGGRSVGLAGTAAGGLAGVLYWFMNWGPAAEVLSYGRNILLIEASGIFADRVSIRAATASIVLASLLALLTSRRSGSLPATLVTLTGPVIGAGSLYVGLRVAAALLTGGELNYSGVKLFYGLVTLALTLGLLALVARASLFGAVGAAASLALVVALHQSSSTASLHTEWWGRTAFGPQPHVIATIDAISQTTPDVPIRCLPSPGTVITRTSNWAAFMCARWMEEAFNQDRFDGHRRRLLDARGDTFEEVVEQILAESPSEYLFAYRFTMGPGWFGWTGPNS